MEMRSIIYYDMLLFYYLDARKTCNHLEYAKGYTKFVTGKKIDNL